MSPWLKINHQVVDFLPLSWFRSVATWERHDQVESRRASVDRRPGFGYNRLMTSKWTMYALVAAAASIAAVLGLPSPAYPHKPITTTILFKNEIAQIFQRKCFQCHTDNNLGMSLTTYTDARPWARAIREEILERRMPPWPAIPGYGHFSNDLSLNAREMEIVLSWTDGGAPSGVLKADESIPPVYVPPVPTWDHGAPDRVLAIGAGHVVGAGTPFEVKRFVVSTGLTAPTRVRSIALKQGDRRVVRHAAFYEASTGRWLGAWTPWHTATRLPEGAAFRLPSRARVIVEIGYSGAEESVTDKSELGLYLEKDRGATAPRSVSTGRTANALRISAAAQPVAVGVAGHRVRTEMRIASPVSAVALWPDPSIGARSIEITSTTREGVVTPLLWIKDFRPDWRSPYFLSSPVTLSTGTRVTMITYFDNVSDKPEVARATAWMTVIPQ